MKTPIRVLQIDDNRLDRELVGDALADEGFHVVEASTRKELEALITKQEFDIVLSDFNILGLTGLDVIDIIKNLKPGLPVILVTGTGSEEVAVAALKKGAADYVIKSPKHIRRLPNAITTVLEQKETRDALRESENRYRALIENLPTVSWESDGQGRISFISPSVERIYGYTPQEIYDAGETLWLGRIHPDDRASVRQAVEKLLADAEEMDVEYRIQRKDGQWIWLQDRSGHVYEKDGKRYACGAFMDITNRKQAQAEIMRNQGQLRSLANALSIAEEKIRKKVATILHDDISQNLVSCKLMIDTEKQSELPADLGQILNTVSEMMGQIAIDTQDLTINLASPTLYKLGLEAALTEWLRDQMEAKHGIRSFFRCDGTTKALDEDIQAFIFRAVKEMGFNAIKHAQAKNLTVELRVEEETALVTVADDGIGFAAEQSVARSAVGTGLGLFSIRERLGYMGGRFQIESCAGQGTKILMSVPTTLPSEIQDA